MAEVGDRVQVPSKRVGQAPRDGVVVAVSGGLLRIEWSTGEESTLSPSMGSLLVVGKAKVRKAVSKGPAAGGTGAKAASKKAAGAGKGAKASGRPKPAAPSKASSSGRGATSTSSAKKAAGGAKRRK